MGIRNSLELTYLGICRGQRAKQVQIQRGCRNELTLLLMNTVQNCFESQKGVTLELLPMVPKVSPSHECRAGTGCMKITVDCSVCLSSAAICFLSPLTHSPARGSLCRTEGKCSCDAEERARQKLVLKWKATPRRNPMHTARRLVLHIYKPRLQADPNKDYP